MGDQVTAALLRPAALRSVLGGPTQVKEQRLKTREGTRQAENAVTRSGAENQVQEEDCTNVWLHNLSLYETKHDFKYIKENHTSQKLVFCSQDAALRVNVGDQGEAARLIHGQPNQGESQEHLRATGR